MPQVYSGQTKAVPKSAVRRIAACIIGQGRKSLICPKTPALEGKRALVTGGTGGIGAALVDGLKARGADVTVAARGRAGQTAGLLKTDLQDLESVAQAVGSMQGDQPYDLVFANAGISPHAYSASKQGYEIAFATNCLGHHLLIHALIDAGLLADGARAIWTTGDIYVLASDCTADFTYKGRGMAAYCRSKLGNLWQAFEMAKRYPQYVSIAAHPGVVATALEGGISGLTGSVKRALLLPPERGAQSSLIAGTQPDMPSGSYIHNMHGRVSLPASDVAQNAQRAAAFWDELDVLVEPYRA